MSTGHFAGHLTGHAKVHAVGHNNFHLPTNAAPAAGFSHSEYGLTSTFTDTSTDDGSIASWAWDFGDSSTSTSQNPSHSYSAAGTYTVQLTVTDNLGSTSTTSQSVTVARTSPTPSVLDSGTNTVDATSFATNSNTPAANQPLYLAVGSSATSAAAPTSVTGNGLTWVQVLTQQNGAANRRLTVYRAAGAAPTAGAITIDFGAQTQSAVAWILVQFANANITGTNGSGATVQSTSSAFATSTTGNLTLSAFEHANNVNLTFVQSRRTAASITADAQFTELVEVFCADFVNLDVQWARGENTCDPSWSSDTALMASIEVKAA